MVIAFLLSFSIMYRVLLYLSFSVFAVRLKNKSYKIFLFHLNENPATPLVLLVFTLPNITRGTDNFKC